jgi:electron transfer flavoprotein beta subunit
MKVVVCVKQVAELPSYIEFSGADIDAAYASYQLNEADMYAIEAGLRLVEAVGAGEVVVIGAGDDGTVETLRRAIAMGAQRAVRVWSDDLAQHDPVAVGRALADAIETEAPRLVLCGVQSSDSRQQSTAPAIGAALGLPCISAAVGIDVEGDRAIVSREFEGGRTEIVAVEGPAVISVHTGLNEPRYGTFKEKMAAKNASIPTIAPTRPVARTTVRRMVIPESTGHVEMIESGAADVASRIVELLQEARR